MALLQSCRSMGLKPFTPRYEIRRLHLIDGRPVLHVSHHLLAIRFPISRVRRWRTLLPNSIGGAVLRLVRVNYDEVGKLVDCDIEHWRPDALHISLDTRALPPTVGQRQQAEIMD